MTPASVLQLSLRYGAVVAAVIAVGGSVIGLAVAGVPGLLSALVGAVLAAGFMGLTAASILVAARATRGGSSIGLYFGIIIGTWLAKFALFVVVALVLSDQDWLQPYLYFGAVVAAVFGSLVADLLAFRRARENTTREAR